MRKMCCTASFVGSYAHSMCVTLIHMFVCRRRIEVARHAALPRSWVVVLISYVTHSHVCTEEGHYCGGKTCCAAMACSWVVALIPYVTHSMCEQGHY